MLIIQKLSSSIGGRLRNKRKRNTVATVQIKNIFIVLANFLFKDNLLNDDLFLITDHKREVVDDHHVMMQEFFVRYYFEADNSVN